MAALQKRFEQYEVDFEAEPTDPSWAGIAEQDFQTDLAPREDDGYTLVDVSCKTTRCVATAEWPTFADAKAGYAALLHRGYAQPCSVATWLPEPDQEGRYQARFFLDCAEEE